MNEYTAGAIDTVWDEVQEMVPWAVSAQWSNNYQIQTNKTCTEDN